MTHTQEGILPFLTFALFILWQRSLLRLYIIIESPPDSSAEWRGKGVITPHV